MKRLLPLILLSALLFAGKAGRAPQWKMFDFYASKSASTGPSFSFPQASTPAKFYPADKFAAYFIQRNTNSYPISGTITATFSITSIGTPTFNYFSEPNNVCSYPANTRFFFGDGGSLDTDRWYALAQFSQVLMPGTFTVSVPIDPAYWGAVNGQQGVAYPAEFYLAAGNVYEIGMVFGGGCFAGHGVNTIGASAQFQLLSWEVQ